MKILKRELKLDPVTTEPVLEVTAIIPASISYDTEMLASDPIVAHLFRQILTQQVESNTPVSGNGVSPMVYDALEELESPSDETVGYTEDDSEWKKLCESHKTHYEELFAGSGQDNPNTVCYVDGLSVHSYMLAPVATRNGEVLVAKTKICKESEFEASLSTLDTVYEIVSYGQLSVDTLNYEKVYRIRGVFKE